MTSELMALLALVPIMAGPLPAREESITARLGSGGTISIPVKRDGEPPKPDHCAKACHASACRKRTAARQADGALDILPEG